MKRENISSIIINILSEFVLKLHNKNHMSKFCRETILVEIMQFIRNLSDFLFDPISVLMKCFFRTAMLLLWKTIYLRLFSILIQHRKFIELPTICRFGRKKWKEFGKCLGNMFQISYDNGNEGFEGHPNGFKSNDLWHLCYRTFHIIDLWFSHLLTMQNSFRSHSRQLKTNTCSAKHFGVRKHINLWLEI